MKLVLKRLNHFLSVLLLATTSIPFFALKASARPCGSDLLSRLGCAIDPTNPARNGGDGMTALNMASIVSTFKASGQVKSRGHCHGLVYDVYRKNWDTFSSTGNLVRAYMTDQLNGGNFACNKEFPIHATLVNNYGEQVGFLLNGKVYTLAPGKQITFNSSAEAFDIEFDYDPAPGYQKKSYRLQPGDTHTLRKVNGMVDLQR